MNDVGYLYRDILGTHWNVSRQTDVVKMTQPAFFVESLVDRFVFVEYDLLRPKIVDENEGDWTYNKQAVDGLLWTSVDGTAGSSQ